MGFEVRVIEVEKGYGKRVIKRMRFDTIQEAKQYYRKVNYVNDLPDRPDFYLYAEEPRRII